MTRDRSRSLMGGGAGLGQGGMGCGVDRRHEMKGPHASEGRTEEEWERDRWREGERGDHAPFLGRGMRDTDSLSLRGMR